MIPLLIVVGALVLLVAGALVVHHIRKTSIEVPEESAAEITDVISTVRPENRGKPVETLGVTMAEQAWARKFLAATYDLDPEQDDAAICGIYLHIPTPASLDNKDWYVSMADVLQTAETLAGTAAIASLAMYSNTANELPRLSFLRKEGCLPRWAATLIARDPELNSYHHELNRRLSLPSAR